MDESVASNLQTKENYIFARNKKSLGMKILNKDHNRGFEIATTVKTKV